MNIGSGLVITATTKKLSTGFLPTTLTAGVLPQPGSPPAEALRRAVCLVRILTV